MLAEAILNGLSVLIRWVPVRFAIVHSYEQGVRWWRGRDTTVLIEAGIYAYIPWIGDITVESVIPQEVETQKQCVQDVNDKALTVSFGIQYRIFDLRLHQTAVDHPDASLLNLVERTAAEVLSEREHEDALRLIRRRVRATSRTWGVDVTQLGYITYAHGRALHLLGSSE